MKTANQKYEMFKSKADLTGTEKMLLDTGVDVTVIFLKQIYKQCHLSYNFIKSKIVIDGITFYDELKQKEKRRKTFQIRNIEKINQFNQEELIYFDKNFSTYF